MNWRVYEATEENRLAHVVPVCGKDHELDEHCWCHPEIDAKHEFVLVHNVVH